LNRRITTALLIACLISGGCTYWLGKRIKVAASARNEHELQYVAAARGLAVGEVVHAEDISWISWPAARPLKGASSAEATMVGRVVLYPLEAGEPILARDVADAGIGAGLASRIPEGKRALALRSDDVVGVAGFLAPQSRVDVLVTYRMGNSIEPITATVLENAEVLAAGQRTEPDPTGKPASATVVTLLVTPLEAERAVLASTQGAVHFVLRNGLDKQVVGSQPVSLAWLGTGPGYDAGNATAVTAAPLKISRSARAFAVLPQAHVETVLGGESGAGAAKSGKDAGDKQP
jgi:pilus assembly protein CpaB